MKQQATPRILPHGTVKRIALLAGVSLPSVSGVINGNGRTSAAMRLKVASATHTVMRQLRDEKAQADETLNDLTV